MTAFEYFSVMVAVVLGLGVTQILAAIGIYVQDPRLVRPYWIHSLWVVMLLAAHFAAWSNIWHLRDSLTFSYGAYVYVLLGPMILYLAVRVLLPQLDRSEPVSVERHYYSVRRSFFLLLLLFVLWPQVLESVIVDRPSAPGGLLIHLAFVLPVALCLFTANRKVHGAAAVYTSFFFVLESATGVA